MIINSNQNWFTKFINTKQKWGIKVDDVGENIHRTSKREETIYDIKEGKEGKL